MEIRVDLVRLANAVAGYVVTKDAQVWGIVFHPTEERQLRLMSIYKNPSTREKLGFYERWP